jgi:hypothetical protein
LQGKIPATFTCRPFTEDDLNELRCYQYITKKETTCTQSETEKGQWTCTETSELQQNHETPNQYVKSANNQATDKKPSSNNLTQSGTTQNKSYLMPAPVTILNKHGTYDVIEGQKFCDYDPYDYEVFLTWVTDSKNLNLALTHFLTGSHSDSSILDVWNDPYTHFNDGIIKIKKSGYPPGEHRFYLDYLTDPHTLASSLGHVSDSEINVRIPPPNCSGQTNTELKKDSGTTSSNTQTTTQNSGNQTSTNPQNATQPPNKYYVKPGDVPTIKRDVQPPPPPKSSDAQEKSQNVTTSQNATNPTTKYTTVDKSKTSTSNTQVKIIPKSTTPVTPKPVTPLK